MPYVAREWAAVAGFVAVGRDGTHEAGTAGRWLSVLAGAAALCTALLGLSTNVTASLVPDKWAKHHTALVLGATGLLALTSVCLAVLAWRHARPRQPTHVADGLQVDRVAAHVEVVGENATVDRSVRAQGGSTVVIAEPGAKVSFETLVAEPAPEQRAGQIVVGELLGPPPAFVAREAVDRLAAVFEAGGRIAAVSPLTGGRGAGKTQVAAQYARQAVADGVELVAWVSADDHDQLLAGLAEVAHRLGVADPEGDSEISSRRLRDVLAARTAPAVLVLDNASDPGAVRSYLPVTGATRVIITSTDRAFTSLGVDVTVDVFDRAQSVAYLSQRTGLANETGADAVADELGDLPLALAQAATVIKLKDLPYEVYFDQLRSLPLDEMLPADRGDAYPHGVARALLLSVEAVQDADATGLTKRALASAALRGSSSNGAPRGSRASGTP